MVGCGVVVAASRWLLGSGRRGRSSMVGCGGKVAVGSEPPCMRCGGSRAMVTRQRRQRGGHLRRTTATGQRRRGSDGSGATSGAARVPVV
eukprot:362692-Chlamydomonas_euryale.AAC.1